MKTETRVVAPCDGRVDRVLCSERQIVSPGAPLFVVEAS
jgi:biotin carboxyl carrier protein